MFFAYVLQSSARKQRYVGSAADVIQRLGQHNAGLSKWTKSGRPWALVYQEAFKTRAEAVKRERYFKTGKGREELDRILGVQDSAG